MSTPIRSLAIFAAGLATTILAAPSTAQDALGSGRALDANLQQGSGGINRGVGRIDFAARNSLITNNVVGGRGFRDTVGYGAVGDFSVDIDDIEDGTGLGSNDIFPFLADSSISSVGALTLGNTYERIRYGQELGLIDIQRPGSSRLAGDFAGGEPADPEDDLSFMQSYLQMQRDLTADRLTRGQQLSQRYEWSMEGAPIGLARSQGPDGQTQFSAVRPDSIRGVDFVPVEQDLARLGLTAYDLARRTADIEAGRLPEDVGRIFEGRYEDLKIEPYRPGIETETEPGEQGEVLEPRMPTSINERLESGLVQSSFSMDPYEDFKRIQQDVAARTAASGVLAESGEEFDAAELQAEIDEIRALLAPHLRPTEGEGEDERSERDRILDPEHLVPDPDADPRVLIPEGGEGSARETMDARTLSRVSTILAHGQTIAHYAVDRGDRFSELMLEGEVAIGRGSYFEAERKFERARIQAPGHPLAAAGVVHARIGAQLYPGAAIELRRLLSERPEMIDVRYDPSLAPAGADLRRAATDLRDRVGNGQDVSNMSLLLAYVGRLIPDQAMVREGLDTASESSPDDPIVPLLRRLWLGESN